MVQPQVQLIICEVLLSRSSSLTSRILWEGKQWQATNLSNMWHVETTEYTYTKKEQWITCQRPQTPLYSYFWPRHRGGTWLHVGFRKTEDVSGSPPALRIADMFIANSHLLTVAKSDVRPSLLQASQLHAISFCCSLFMRPAEHIQHWTMAHPLPEESLYWAVPANLTLNKAATSAASQHS